LAVRLVTSQGHGHGFADSLIQGQQSAEIAKRDQAEPRRLLAASQQMANTLAAQFERKALPPASVVEVPRRVRLWKPWHR
jgi:hypothetical protein